MISPTQNIELFQALSQEGASNEKELSLSGNQLKLTDKKGGILSWIVNFFLPQAKARKKISSALLLETLTVSKTSLSEANLDLKRIIQNLQSIQAKMLTKKDKPQTETNFERAIEILNKINHEKNSQKRVRFSISDPLDVTIFVIDK